MPTAKEKLQELQTLGTNEDIIEVIRRLEALFVKRPVDHVPETQVSSGVQALREGRVTPCVLQARFANNVFDMKEIFPATQARAYFEKVTRSLFVFPYDAYNIDGIDPQKGKYPRDDFKAAWETLVKASQEGESVIPATEKLQQWVDNYMKPSKEYKALPQEEKQEVEYNEAFPRVVVCAGMIAAQMGWSSLLPCEINGFTIHMMAFIYTKNPERLWCDDLNQLSATVKKVMRYEAETRQQSVEGEPDLKKCNPRALHIALRLAHGAFIDGRLPMLEKQEARDMLVKAITQEHDDPRKPCDSRGKPMLTHLCPVANVVQDESSAASVEKCGFALGQCTNTFLIRVITESFMGVEEDRYVVGQLFFNQEPMMLKIGKMSRVVAMAAIAAMPSFSDYDQGVLKSLFSELSNLIANQGTLDLILRKSFYCYDDWKDSAVGSKVRQIASEDNGEFFVIKLALSDLSEQVGKGIFIQNFHSNCAYLTLGGVFEGIGNIENRDFVGMFKVMGNQWQLEGGKLDPVVVVNQKWPKQPDREEICSYVFMQCFLGFYDPAVTSFDLVERLTVWSGVEPLKQSRQEFCDKVLPHWRRGAALTESHQGIVRGFIERLESFLRGVVERQQRQQAVCGEGRENRETESAAGEPSRSLEFQGHAADVAVLSGSGSSGGGSALSCDQASRDNESGEAAGPDQSLSYSGAERRVSQTDASMDRVS